jgi:hypothetical protein
VEAAVLIVAIGVLTLLFQRAEGRAFHLPGGDGGVILAAGLWTCVLIVWRIFDKQGATTNGPSATSSGIEWGIFIALAAAAFLAYSGSRIRAAHRPEPPLPGEDAAPAGSSAAATTIAGEATTARARAAATSSATEATTTIGGEAASRRPRSAPPTGRRPVPPRRRPASSPPARTAPRPYMASPAGPSPPRVPGEARPDRSGSAGDAHPDRSESAGDAHPDRSGSAGDAHPDRSRNATPIPEATTQPGPGRPRRRHSAAELFERVVPDDPPTMPFGRAKPADVDAALRMSSSWRGDEPAATTPSHERLTTQLGDDDETRRLDRDDDTLRLDRDDDTLRLDRDPGDTLPLDRDR